MAALVDHLLIISRRKPILLLVILRKSHSSVVKLFENLVVICLQGAITLDHDVTFQDQSVLNFYKFIIE